MLLFNVWAIFSRLRTILSQIIFYLPLIFLIRIRLGRLERFLVLWRIYSKGYGFVPFQLSILIRRHSKQRSKLVFNSFVGLIKKTLVNSLFFFLTAFMMTWIKLKKVTCAEEIQLLRGILKVLETMQSPHTSNKINLLLAIYLVDIFLKKFIVEDVKKLDFALKCSFHYRYKFPLIVRI